VFAFLEAVLALIGLFAVIAVYALYRDGVFDESPPGPPDPYREGLDAAARISARAWELDELMHQVAEQSHREAAE